MSKVIPRGLFVVLEGGDRCGKTTQCSRLVEALNQQGLKTQTMKFPARETGIGKMISGYLEKNTELEDHAVHLLFTANRWEAVPTIKRLLAEGINLIVDRYSYSGVAYTAAKGLDMRWCISPEVGLPKPDVVLYLNVTPEVAAQRAAYGTERYEDVAFQKKVTNNYQILSNLDTNWQEIDCSRSIEEIHLEIMDVVQNLILKPHDNTIDQLWTDLKDSKIDTWI